MLRITALSTIVVIGLVAGNPFSNYENYGIWTPMCPGDDQYVCKVIATKFTRYPQIGQILDGKKENLSGGERFLFLYNSVDNQRCCGLLEDEYHVEYQCQCDPSFNSCHYKLFENYKEE